MSLLLTKEALNKSSNILIYLINIISQLSHTSSPTNLHLTNSLLTIIHVEKITSRGYASCSLSPSLAKKLTLQKPSSACLDSPPWEISILSPLLSRATTVQISRTLKLHIYQEQWWRNIMGVLARPRVCTNNERKSGPMNPNIWLAADAFVW